MTEMKFNEEVDPLQGGGIDITYFTDPLCCWSWAFEPEWRKLQYEFKGLITWHYCMGGLIPAWNNYVDPINSISRPAQMGPVWMYASQLSGMYMDKNIWIKEPPASSYPACIAVKCAQLQSPEYGQQYLRLLRETVMLKGINIARYDVLLDLADILTNRATGFNKNLFEQHLFGKPGLEAFKTDMQKVKNYNISRFPTLIFTRGQQSMLITGYRPYSALIDVLYQINPDIKATQQIKSKKEYALYWQSITEREIQEALNDRYTKSF